MTVEQSAAVTARSKRWHQSTMSSLLDGCSWQYFLAYILGLDQGVKPYALAGTAYHSAIELHEINRMAGKETTKEEMADVIRKSITEAVEGEDLQNELITNSCAALENWWLHHREWLLGYTPVAIEPEFTLPLVDTARPIGGYIDAVYRDADGKHFIVDHKTAKTFDRWRSGEGHRTQATMYSVALVLSDEFPEISELPEMVYMVSRTSLSKRKDFEGGRVVRVQPTIEDVQLLGDRIRAAEEVVETEKYKTNTSWPLCSPKWCPFYEGCQVTGTLLGTPEVVKARMRQQSTPAPSVFGTQGSGPTQLEQSDPTTTEEVTHA